jgi:hypothetical protein
MFCPEYNRLQPHYEAAVRRWGNVLLSSGDALVGTAARQAVEVKRKAFEERNAAKERLTAHTLACQTCDPRLRVNRRA